MLENTRTGLTAFWDGLATRQRTLVIGSAVLLLISFVVAVIVALGEPEYVKLYSGLDGSEASAITKKLTEKKIKVKVTDGGSTVAVSSKDLDAARLALATDNLLPKGTSGSVGLEIFDQTKIGTTEFERRVNYVRAIQGELERTFRQMEGVDSARIMIVLPEQSLFVQREKPASAAVWLKLKPGVKLDDGQIKGIVRLVSHSVENLKPDAVTVVDVNGRILSSGIDLGSDQPSAAAVSTGRLEIQKKFQADLEKSLQSLLEQVLGPGNVAARVTAELNFDQKTSDITFFKPQANGQGILRSVEELSRTFKGTPGSGGPAGTDSNTPGNSGSLAVPTYPSLSSAGTSESEETTRRANYEIDSIKEQIVVAPGALKRLSVAVVVNRSLNPAETAAIEKTVAAAIGLDPKRDDQINITGLTFNTDLAGQMGAAIDAERQERQAVNRNLYIAAGVAGLLVLLVLRSLTRSARRISAEVAMAGTGQPLGFPVSLSEMMSESEEPPEPKRELTPEERAKQKMEKEIHKLAADKPEDVANLLKSWLSEEK